MGITYNYTAILQEILDELKTLNKKVDALSDNGKDKELEKVKNELHDVTNKLLDM